MVKHLLKLEEYSIESEDLVYFIDSKTLSSKNKSN